MGNLLTKSKSNEIPKKYLENRDSLKSGDVILYRGTGFLAKTIQYFDDAYYNHVGIVWKLETGGEVEYRLLTLDMWSEGLTLKPLSFRMVGYEDFCVLRPKVSKTTIKTALNTAINEWEASDIKYDYLLLPRIALVKKTGIDLTGLGSRKKFVCSEFGQEYFTNIGIMSYADIKLITPQDFLRYIDLKKVELLLCDAGK
jgi:hypothetical protein